MSTLFELLKGNHEIAEQVEILAQQYEDGTIDDEAFAQAMEATLNAESDSDDAIKAKAAAWCGWIQSRRIEAQAIRGKAAALLEEVERLKRLAEVIENKAKNDEEFLVRCLLQRWPDQKSFELPHGQRIRSRSSGDRLEIVDSAQIPAEFMITPKAEPRPDMLAIRKRLQEVIAQRTKGAPDGLAERLAAGIRDHEIPGARLLPPIRRWSVQ